MARYRSYSYKQDQLVMLNPERELESGTLEHAIHYIIEERINGSIFLNDYNNDETGRPAYDPKILLKIILLGYSRGILSSRKLEQACLENIKFMAMSCGQSPDHTTLSKFMTHLGDKVQKVFEEVLLICHELGLLSGTHLSLDGLKLPGNASKDSSGTFETLKKKREKVSKKIEQLREEHAERDRNAEEVDEKEKSREEDRLKRLERESERIEKFLSQNEPRMGRSGKEVQSNITDNESARMHSRKGPTQGFNAQALVIEESQVIVSNEAYGSGHDQGVGEKMLAKASLNLKKAGFGEEALKGKKVSADCAYHSEENLEACNTHEVDAYIPDHLFRSRNQKFDTRHKSNRPKKKKFEESDFKYNEASDSYECPHGKELKLTARASKTRERIYRKYIANEVDCQNCPLRGKCLSGKRSKRRCLSIYVSKVEGSLREAMRIKIDDPANQKIYNRRIGIVEPVFGNIRANKKMNRFTVRGLKKVNIQWTLYCLVHNLEKISKAQWKLKSGEKGPLGAKTSPILLLLTSEIMLKDELCKIAA